MSTQAGYSCQRSLCGRTLTESEVYEYRGVIFCEEHFDVGREATETVRSERIRRQDSETAFAKDLDFSSDTPIGQANQELFADRVAQYKKATKNRPW